MKNPISHILGHLVSCKDVSRLLSREQEAPLTGWERIRMKWHLAVCGMCRAFERQLRFLQKAMRRYRQ
jgi:hypothetical protein